MMRCERLRAVFWALAAAGVCSFSASTAFAVAFQSAEGEGASASGGRGGAVYHVTNLNDSGAGSLRYGIDNASGPTTIVFDVGGTINLQSQLWFYKSDMTIAGQTAPGDGIQITGAGAGIANANNVIMRYLRFRPGNAGEGVDAMSIVNSQNVIVDHLSTQWGTDETLSVTLSNYVTVQNCIIAQTLNSYSHSYASLVRGNVTTTQAGGYTFHHNLWAENDARNPGLGAKQDADDGKNALEFVNNVIYDWGARCMHSVQSKTDVYMNCVNNMFIAGTDSDYANRVYTLEFEINPDWDGDLQIYQTGNKIDTDKNSTHNPVDVTTSMYKDSSWWGGIYFQANRYNYAQVTTQTAADAYTSVLANVGCSLSRDSLDSTIVSNVQNRTGSCINTAPAAPTISGGTCDTDTDQDGLPDYWETMLGLNPNYAADGAADSGTGYTNLENYLNYLTGDWSGASFAPVPEPSTLVLLAVGALALLLRRRMAK